MSKASFSRQTVSNGASGGGTGGTVTAASLALKATLLVLYIAVLVLLAASRLLYPLGGDGALFLTAAKMIGSGGVLYVDFWDVKQPGIYYYYLFAGRTFGFTFEGVHLFEMAYWIIVGSLVFIFARRYLHNPWVAIVGPLALLGTYYSHTRMEYHAQVEIIANGPILLAAIFLMYAGNTAGGRRYLQVALAGAFGALVVALKLALAPIVMAVFAVHILMCMRNRSAVLTIVRDAAFFSIGGASALLAMSLALYWAGGLDGALEAAFVIGPDWALNAPAAPVSRLVQGALNFSKYFVFWGGLALVGLAYVRSEKQRPLVWLCLAWIGASIFCILVQRFSWWPYHWQLLVVPIALLATLGADFCLEWLGRRTGMSQRAKLWVAVVVSLPVIGGYQQVISMRLSLYRAHEHEIAQGDFDGFRASVSKAYANALKVAEALPVDIEPATVYVMGDPLVYVVRGDVQAIPVHGWALEFFSSLSWTRLTEELQREMPEAILLMPYYENHIDEKAPRIRELLNDNYSLVSQTPLGDWYVNGELH